MRVRILILICVIFASCGLWAEQTPAAELPATREDILKLFEVMNIHQQMPLVLDSMMKQQRSLIRETMKKRYPDFGDEQMAQFDSIMQETMKNFPVDAMLNDMVPVYQKYLTRTDVDAMSAFYASPTGKKLLREMPAMTSESMQLAYGRMQKQMETMMDRIQEMMQEDPSKRKTSPKPRTQPPPQMQRD
jgi:uncharacterized protein